MKYKFLLLASILFVLLANNAKCNNSPEIVWEKQIPITSYSLNPWAFMHYSNDGILLWLGGVATKAPKSRYSILRTDKYGNNLKQIDYIDTISSNYYYAQINKSNNNYEIIGSLSFGDYGITTIRKNLIDSNLNIVETFHNNNKLGYFNENTLISYHYDSVYVGFRHTKSDSNELQHFQSQLVFGPDAQFARVLNFDTTGINESVQMSQSQTLVFPNKDRNLITTFQSPIDYALSSWGKVDYILVCNYNLSGELIWKCKVDISTSGYETIRITKMHQTSDGSYLFYGYYSRLNNSIREYHGFLGNISESGVLQWLNTFDYAYNTLIPATEPLLINDGNYFVHYGYFWIKPSTQRKFWLMVVDKNGSKLDEYVWSTEDTDNGIIDLAETENGNLVLLGRDGWHSIYLAEIKLKFASGIKIQNSPLKWLNVNLSPNPASEFINISIENNFFDYEYNCKLINLQGEIIREFSMKNELILDTKDLGSGSYYLNIRDTGGKSNFTKLINIIK